MKPANVGILTIKGSSSIIPLTLFLVDDPVLRILKGRMQRIEYVVVRWMPWKEGAHDLPPDSR
jgi:hypothetical protein